MSNNERSTMNIDDFFYIYSYRFVTGPGQLSEWTPWSKEEKYPDEYKDLRLAGSRKDYVNEEEFSSMTPDDYYGSRMQLGMDYMKLFDSVDSYVVFMVHPEYPKTLEFFWVFDNLVDAMDGFDEGDHRDPNWIKLDEKTYMLPKTNGYKLMVKKVPRQVKNY